MVLGYLTIPGYLKNNFPIKPLLLRLETSWKEELFGFERPSTKYSRVYRPGNSGKFKNYDHLLRNYNRKTKI